jgi:hypothetical protein
MTCFVEYKFQFFAIEISIRYINCFVCIQISILTYRSIINSVLLSDLAIFKLLHIGEEFSASKIIISWD